MSANTDNDTLARLTWLLDSLDQALPLLFWLEVVEIRQERGTISATLRGELVPGNNTVVTVTMREGNLTLKSGKDETDWHVLELLVSADLQGQHDLAQVHPSKASANYRRASRFTALLMGRLFRHMAANKIALQ